MSGGAGFGGMAGDAGTGGNAGASGQAGAAGALVTSSIVSGSDDVNEDGPDFAASQASVWFGTGDSPDQGYTGLRFASVPIPAGVTVLDAWLELYAPSNQPQPIEVLLGVESNANCKVFSTGQPPSGRDLTAAVPASASEPWDAQAYNRFGDLSAPVQEVVNLPSWSEGSPMCVVVQGQGPALTTRFTTSYDGDSALAPRLHIRYVP